MVYVLKNCAAYHHDYLGSTHYTQNVHARNKNFCSSRFNSIEFSALLLGIPGIFLIFLLEEEGFSFSSRSLQISALKSIGNVDHAALSFSCSCICSKQNFFKKSRQLIFLDLFSL